MQLLDVIAQQAAHTRIGFIHDPAYFLIDLFRHFFAVVTLFCQLAPEEDLLLSLATCAAMLWASLAGPIFLSAAADQVARLALLLIAVAVLAWEGLRLRTGLRPAPG